MANCDDNSCYCNPGTDKEWVAKNRFSNTRKYAGVAFGNRTDGPPGFGLNGPSSWSTLVGYFQDSTVGSDGYYDNLGISPANLDAPNPFTPAWSFDMYVDIIASANFAPLDWVIPRVKEAFRNRGSDTSTGLPGAPAHVLPDASSPADGRAAATKHAAVRGDAPEPY